MFDHEIKNFENLVLLPTRPHWHASLLKMSLLRRCFSLILLVQMNLQYH